MKTLKLSILLLFAIISAPILAQEDDDEGEDPASTFIMIDDDGEDILMMGTINEEEHTEEDEVVDDSFLYDDYDYSAEYTYYVPCSHSGNIRVWEVVRIRLGLASYDLPIAQRGKVVLSESCIEIDCSELEMSFEIASWKKVFPNFYQVYRNNPDKLGDYMEIKQGFGRDSMYWWLLIGTLTEDGMMENTIQVTCKPLKTTMVK